MDKRQKILIVDDAEFNIIYSKNSPSSTGGRWIVDRSINAQKNFINEKENICSRAGIVL